MQRVRCAGLDWNAHALEKAVKTRVRAQVIEPGNGSGVGDPGCAFPVRVVYQDFVALWRDADPDVPILKEAKTEYAKLK